MKIKPVILCGGAGTRLWPDSKKNPAKQFIDFGGWTLFQKTLERIKDPIFDYPIISTNSTYLKLIRKYLLRNKVKRYKSHDKIHFHFHPVPLSNSANKCGNHYFSNRWVRLPLNRQHTFYNVRS